MKAHDKLNRCLSHSSWVTSYETLQYNFCKSVEKQCREGENEK